MNYYHELSAASYHPYLCPGWAVARIPKSSSVPGCSGCIQRQLQGRVSTTSSQAAAAKLYELLFQIPDSAGLKQPEVLKVLLVRAISPLAGGSQTQESVRISGFPQAALKLRIWPIFSARLCPVFAPLLGALR